MPGSGSFIRPSPSITYGQSFLRALISKYVELPRPSGRKETIILGSSNGIIEVEAVGLDKVRDKLAKLEYLRGISLDTEDVAYPNPPGEIRKTCRSKSKKLLSPYGYESAILPRCTQPRYFG